MPKRKNIRKNSNKTTKRKQCKRTNKKTGFGPGAYPIVEVAKGALTAAGAAGAGGTIWPIISTVAPAIGITAAGAAGAAALAAKGISITALLKSAATTILSCIPGLANLIGNASVATLSAAAVAAGFVGPPLWDGIKFLSKTGFKCLYRFLVDFWKDYSSDTIDTTNIKAIIVDIRRQLIHKNPAFKQDPIMEDLSELNKLCFTIDSMNQNGLSSQEYDELRQKLTDDLKYILREFRELMYS